MTEEQEALWKIKKREQMAEWKKKNPEKVRESAQKSREKNRDALAAKARLAYHHRKEITRDAKRAAARRSYSKNTEKCRARVREYRLKNKEAIREKSRERDKMKRVENPEYVRKIKRDWARANPESVRNTRKRWEAKRVITPFQAMRLRVRARTSMAIRAMGFKKTSGTAKMIGCDWPFLQSWLESKFKKGMTWANMNKWHIDHIIPISSARNESELMHLCHFSNLQPLWATENIRKRDRITMPQMALAL